MSLWLPFLSLGQKSCQPKALPPANQPTSLPSPCIPALFVLESLKFLKFLITKMRLKGADTYCEK